MTLVAAVPSAANIAASGEQQAAAGRLPRDQAQKAAKEAIKAARCGGADGKTDYFYIWSGEATAWCPRSSRSGTASRCSAR